MGDLYASLIGTTVLQIREIPPRPPEYDGILCLFGLAADETAVRAALSPFGTIRECRLDLTPAQVHFDTHEAARAVRRRCELAVSGCTTAEEASAAVEAALGLQCAGADTLYNERSYGGRRGEPGRDDDDGRGWCVTFPHVPPFFCIR
jgi:hypothetical protein